MNPAIKLIVGPMLIIVAIIIMYIISIAPGEAINRADIAFGLMAFLAAIHCWIAHRWYMKGYLTYEMMKAQEKAAVKIIEVLTKRVNGNKQKILKEATQEVLDEALTELTDIINKHQS